MYACVCCVVFLGVCVRVVQGRGKVFYVGGAVGGGSISAYKYYAK